MWFYCGNERYELIEQFFRALVQIALSTTTVSVEVIIVKLWVVSLRIINNTIILTLVSL